MSRNYKVPKVIIQIDSFRITLTENVEISIWNQLIAIRQNDHLVFPTLNRKLNDWRVDKYVVLMDFSIAAIKKPKQIDLFVEDLERFFNKTSECG